MPRTRSRSYSFSDDVHWCDDSSAAAIHYVARMNRDKPVFGILASRVADISDNIAAQQAVAGLRHDGLLTDMPIGPLREEDLVQLIRERAPDADAEKLGSRCGGNPLLAIELARAEIQGAEGTSLNELVSERLARISVDGAEVLQWAAVLSPHIGIDRIAALSGIEQQKVTEVFESAIRQGMFTSTGSGVGFTHELLARSVYRMLSPMRRQVMHRRAAEYLEDSVGLDLNKAADLAYHATQSGDPGLAARALVSAARMCLRFYDNEKALIHARRAMQLAEQLPGAERVCVLIELSEVRFLAGPAGRLGKVRRRVCITRRAGAGSRRTQPCPARLSPGGDRCAGHTASGRMRGSNPCNRNASCAWARTKIMSSVSRKRQGASL